MYFVINKWVTAVKVSNFFGQYLRNRSTLDIGVLGYIGTVWPKERSPEVWHIPPGTTFIYIHIYIYGHAVAQLVEALRYKPDGGGFDSRLRQLNFSLS